MTSKPKGIFGISARCLQYKFPYISLINERSNMLKVVFAKSILVLALHFHLFWLVASIEELSVHADESKCRCAAN
jgi:hypothetical protein